MLKTFSEAIFLGVQADLKLSSLIANFGVKSIFRQEIVKRRTQGEKV